MNGKQIICDTNIWYSIAEGKIQLESLSNINLVFTYLNMVEFATTPNLYNRPSHVKNAIKSALIHSKGNIIFDHALEVVSKSFHQTSLANDLVQRHRLLEELRYFSRQSAESTLKKIQSSELVSIIKDIVVELEFSTDRINNDILPKVRKRFSSKLEKRTYAQSQSIDNVTEFWRRFSSLAINDKFMTFPKQLDAKGILPLLHLTDTFFKDLELNENRKFKRNDWPDLLHIAYIRNEDYLFWTFDKPLSHMIRQAGLEHILYEHK
ncbi:MAG: hypothetical protein ACK44D_12480 [Bacteroidia bacterium]